MTIEDKINISKTPISKLSKKYCVPKRDLLIKFLIDSHQFSEKEILNMTFINKRIEILAKNIKESRKKTDPKFLFKKIDFLNKDKCSVSVLNWRISKEILTYYHHIGSYRPKSIHLGLYYEIDEGNKKLLGIATFSKYDFHFRPYSLFAIARVNEILNLSRFYLFGWAPPFSTSHYLSKCIQFIKYNYPKIKCLITCINPNTMHGGSSFEASNWIETAEFTGAPYLFLDQKYVTVRHLNELFGTLDIRKLKEKLGNRLSVSTEEILPQKMYLYALNKKAKRKFFDKRLDKVFSFNHLILSPEYGLTDNKVDKSVTKDKALGISKRLGVNVIAGFLENYKNNLYSSIIVTTPIDTRFSRFGQKPLVVDLDDLSKTIVLFGSQFLFDYENIIEECKNSDINSMIILSYKTEDTRLILDKIKNLSDKLNVHVIFFNYFQGFKYIKI